MNFILTLYVAVLFFLLTPNILFRIPTKGSFFLVSGIHALLFALIFHFTQKFVWQISLYTSNNEGMKGRNNVAKKKKKKIHNKQ